MPCWTCSFRSEKPSTNAWITIVSVPATAAMPATSTMIADRVRGTPR